jgi:plastocyanin
VTGILVLGALLLRLSAPYTPVDIVDDPRPQPRWGYAPRTTSITTGTWVVWSNAGTDTHTVTAVDGAFDSHELNPSEGFSWYFDTPGTFSYLCSLHPWMTGTVVVVQDDDSA